MRRLLATRGRPREPAGGAPDLLVVATRRSTPCSRPCCSLRPALTRGAAAPSGRPVLRSQAGAAACVHHRHSSKARAAPPASSSAPARTAATAVPSCSSTPRSCARAGRPARPGRPAVCLPGRTRFTTSAAEHSRVPARCERWPRGCTTASGLTPCFEQRGKARAASKGARCRIFCCVRVTQEPSALSPQHGSSQDAQVAAQGSMARTCLQQAQELAARGRYMRRQDAALAVQPARRAARPPRWGRAFCAQGGSTKAAHGHWRRLHRPRCLRSTSGDQQAAREMPAKGSAGGGRGARDGGAAVGRDARRARLGVQAVPDGQRQLHAARAAADDHHLPRAAAAAACGGGTGAGHRRMQAARSSAAHGAWRCLCTESAQNYTGGSAPRPAFSCFAVPCCHAASGAAPTGSAALEASWQEHK